MTCAGSDRCFGKAHCTSSDGAGFGEDARATGELLFALLLLLTVWCAILVGHALRLATREPAWIVASFALAAAILGGARRRRSFPFAPGAVSLGFAAGFASYPAWVATIWVLGAAAGLPVEAEVARSLAAPSPAPAAIWLATVLLSPLFEELLYRERLLPALRARFGVGWGVALSSALFAVSHVHAWSVLSALLVGLSLGLVYVASGSVALCIAMHAGFNLATLVCGLPPERYVLAPGSSALASWTLMLCAIGWLRRRARATARAPAVQRG